MPELPEVETVRRTLAPALEGKVIDRVMLARPDLRWPFPERFAERLTGRRVEMLGRRAKYLVGRLDDGAALVMHLGMSGAFRIDGAATGVPIGEYVHAKGKLAAHDHVTFAVGPNLVVYNDPRRFGFMTLAEWDRLDAHPHFARLGVEPVRGALTAERLAARLAGKATPLKAALLDQRVVAGLGNIYVCEALWRARLSPRRLAGSVPRKDGTAGERITRLAEAIVAVIEDAVAAGGTSLRDYVAADGEPGAYQHTAAIYGRENAPCVRPGCRGVIRRIVQSARSTWYCPECQR